MKDIPKNIGIIGAGAIGIEFAYFWNAFGVNVHIFELQKHLLPLEDEDCSKEIEMAYKKYGIKMSLGLDICYGHKKYLWPCCHGKKSGKREKTFKFDKILIAVGMKGNIEHIGLESMGIKTERVNLLRPTRWDKQMFLTFMLSEMSPVLLCWPTLHPMKALLRPNISCRKKSSSSQ